MLLCSHFCRLNCNFLSEEGVQYQICPYNHSFVSIFLSKVVPFPTNEVLQQDQRYCLFKKIYFILEPHGLFQETSKKQLTLTMLLYFKWYRILIFILSELYTIAFYTSNKPSMSLFGCGQLYYSAKSECDTHSHLYKARFWKS